MAKRKPEPQTPPLSAAQVMGLLAARHAKDVFVPECKNGPTHTADDLLRLDAWAMPKSWAHHTTIGYEVKVSRSDFEQDQKYLRYADYCHQLFLVCPAGLIKAVDLPSGVGLIWASVNGSRLHVKVPATKRKPPLEKHVELLYYVLMCRTRIVGDMWEANREGKLVKPVDELHRETVAEAEKRKQLAYFVNAHIRARFDEQEQRIAALQGEVDMVNEFRKELEEAGIPWPENRWGSWETRRLLQKKIGQLDHGVVEAADNLARHLRRFVDDNRKPVALAETGT